MNASAALVVVAFLLFTATSAAVGANLTVNARGGGVVVEKCVPTIVEVEPEPTPEPEPEPTPSPTPEPTVEETTNDDVEPEQLQESD